MTTPPRRRTGPPARNPGNRLRNIPGTENNRVPLHRMVVGSYLDYDLSDSRHEDKSYYGYYVTDRYRAQVVLGRYEGFPPENFLRPLHDVIFCFEARRNGIVSGPITWYIRCPANFLNDGSTTKIARFIVGGGVSESLAPAGFTHDYISYVQGCRPDKTIDVCSSVDNVRLNKSERVKVSLRDMSAVWGAAYRCKARGLALSAPLWETSLPIAQWIARRTTRKKRPIKILATEPLS